MQSVNKGTWRTQPAFKAGHGGGEEENVFLKYWMCLDFWQFLARFSVTDWLGNGG